MRKEFDNDLSFKFSQIPLSQTAGDTENRYEFGCEQLAGFKAGDLKHDITYDDSHANDLWHTLTNQNDYYFIMVEHDHTNSNLKRYKNRKNIVISDYHKILNLRGLRLDGDRSFNLKDSRNFSMESVFDKDLFNREFFNLLEWLEIEPVVPSKLDDLRMLWISGIANGFKNNKENIVQINQEEII
jgi:hypothetical protein